MTADIDLRPLAGADRRRRLVATLEYLERGEAVTVRADDDVDVLLHQYQFEHGELLEWDGVVQDDSGGQDLTVRKGDPLGDDELVEFDVRDMPPQRRHGVLLETFDRLEQGQASSS